MALRSFRSTATVEGELKQIIRIRVEENKAHFAKKRRR
jgi:hypothetical protein